MPVVAQIIESIESIEPMAGVAVSQVSTTRNSPGRSFIRNVLVWNTLPYQNSEAHLAYLSACNLGASPAGGNVATGLSETRGLGAPEWPELWA
jgi:hypothetical protein